MRKLNRRAALRTIVGAPAIAGLPLLRSSSHTIQDQIDAGPGWVEVAAGTHPEGLTIRDRVHLRGEGAGVTSVRSITSEGAAALWGTNAAVGPSKFSVSHLTVEGALYHGIALYGYGFALGPDLIARGNGLDNIYTEWSSDLVTPDIDQVIARFDGVKSHHAGRYGIANNGPHDMQWANVESFLNAEMGILIAEKGTSLQAVNCHVWGSTHDWAWWVDGANCQFANVLGEGGAQGAFLLLRDGTRGDVWAYGVPEAPTKGIELGAAGRPVKRTRLTATIENCVAGALVLTNDGGNRIEGDVIAPDGAPIVVGAGATGTQIDLHDAARGRVYRRTPPVVTV